MALPLNICWNLSNNAPTAMKYITRFKVNNEDIKEETENIDADIDYHDSSGQVIIVVPSFILIDT
jgi:hypothetical protein